jgi:hypothetical protein
MLKNLPMFAPDKGDEGGELPNMDDFTLDEGIELDAESDDEIELPEEETEKPEKPEKPESTEKMVSLKALQAQRAKFKKQIEALQAQITPKKAETNSYKDKLQTYGVSDDVADLLASVLSGAEGKTANIEKAVNKKFRDQEFKELAKDPIFSDIEEHREELEETADRHGISIEDAYFQKYGKTKIKANQADLRRQIEQEILDNLKKKGSMKFDTTDNGEPDTTSKKVKLSSDDLAVAKMSGMTARDYAIFKYGKSVDQFKMTKKG